MVYESGKNCQNTSLAFFRNSRNSCIRPCLFKLSDRPENYVRFTSRTSANLINLACIRIRNVHSCKIPFNWYFTSKEKQNNDFSLP